MKSSLWVTAFKLRCVLLEMGLRERSITEFLVGWAHICLKTKGSIRFVGERYRKQLNYRHLALFAIVVLQDSPKVANCKAFLELC